MSDFYTPEELRAKFNDKKWIMPYSRLTAVVGAETSKVLYIEEYGPTEGVFVEGWRALHYPLTSNLVEKTYREGSATVVRLKQGNSGLKLAPSIAPFGISECRVDDKEVSVTFEGLGGAGVSAAYSRGMAEGVDRVIVHNHAGGAQSGSSTVIMKKSGLLLIGVDDTDDETVGATYALVDTIAKEICSNLNLRYMVHVNVQLYPYNELKTRNCFSTVIGIIYKNKKDKKLIKDYFITQLKEHTVSAHTAMATYDGFCLPKKFVNYCISLKFRMATDIDELKRLAHESGVEMHEITGDRGLFGAVGSLGFWDQPDFAAKLPSQCA